MRGRRRAMTEFEFYGPSKIKEKGGGWGEGLQESASQLEEGGVGSTHAV
jgi:hypothetical protein